jgi:endoglucanase
MPAFLHPGPRVHHALVALAATAIAGSLLLGAKAPAHGGGGATPQIRVDQVGYPATATKRAYLMTGTVATGATFGVRTATTTAFSGTVGADLGSWSSSYGHVYPIDFDGLATAGTYTIVVSGPVNATSTPFRVDAGAAVTTQALRNALAFYQVQRDGPNFIASALRTAGSHLHDAAAMTYSTPSVNKNGGFRGDLSPLGGTIDASGGWWDAGDYLKFLHASTYTDALLLTGVRDFPAQMGAGGAADFTAEAKFGADWILRMWDDPTKTLYYQVGIGGGNGKTLSDHDIWRLPQADDHYQGTNPHYVYIRHPPVFRAGRPGARISPNLAGRLAADFALCYQVLRHSDPGYAGGCLRSAETVYSLADPHWKGHLMTAIPWDFYPETTWRDDMMLGATELARALQEAGHRPAGLPVRSAGTYLRDAASWASAWIHSRQALGDTLNLYDVSALADYELVLAIRGQHAAGLAVTTAQLMADLRGQIEKGIAVAARDPFGFGFAWDQWDTTTHGAGLTVMADEYDALAGRPVYAAWGQRWLDDILGSNAWGVSLIVGDGTVYPDCMQHQVANLAGSLDGQPPVLAGAAVEGPNSFAATGTVAGMRPCAANAPQDVPYAAFNGQKAVFADNVQSYSTVEPAIDLTALTPLAFAWQQQNAAR